MSEKEEFLYEAFKAKDTRFDGRYFVGISSTKIYCRPTCWAKQPSGKIAHSFRQPQKQSRQAIALAFYVGQSLRQAMPLSMLRHRLQKEQPG